MHGRLMTACMAIAAFAAFVMAPAASASPELTESGTTLAVGASITAKNNGVTKFTGAFGVECKVADLKGTVTKNNGTEVEWEIPEGSTTFTNEGGAECSSALGPVRFVVTSKLCIASINKTDTVTMTGCGTNPVRFHVKVLNITICKYSVSTITGTYVTSSSPGKFSLTEQAASEEEPRQFFCPDTGSLDMTFEMFTTGGTTAVAIS